MTGEERQEVKSIPISMPPKTKSPKVKPDWVLCNQSGIMYHSSDTDKHTSWLSSGSETPPPHSHIISNTFHCSVSVSPQSVIAPSLSSRLSFSSVFVHPSLAKQCGFGQANLLKVNLIFFSIELKPNIKHDL